MATLCIQCSLRALVAGTVQPLFDEGAEAHQRRLHPDLAETQRERVELERVLKVRVDELRDSRGQS